MPFPLAAIAAAGGSAGAAGGIGSFLGSIGSALGGAEGIGSLIGLGGGFLDAGSAAEAKKKFKKNVKNTYAKAQALSDYGFQQQQQVLDAQMLGANNAFDTALKQTKFAGTQSQQATMDQGKQALGNALGGAEAAGLGSSTIAQNAAIGVSAQTSKALASINAMTSQMTGALGLQKQQTIGGLQAQQGNLASAQAAANADLLFGKMGQLQGVAGPNNIPMWMLGPPEYQGTDWSSVGQAIGSIDWGGG